MPLFTSGGLGLGLVSSGLVLGLGLVILVLVLRIWSCLHHCLTQPKTVGPNSAQSIEAFT